MRSPCHAQGHRPSHRHTETTVAVASGTTREGLCPPCAVKACRLRARQCREGWHLAEELPDEPGCFDMPPDYRHRSDDSDDSDDTEPGASDEQGGRRVRSTRRRQHADDLPRVPVENRTVGTAFTMPDGTTCRPTLTARFGRDPPPNPQGRDK